MVAHPPVADGPGTYTALLAAQTHEHQLVNVALARDTDYEAPDWAQSVYMALECAWSCELGEGDGVRRCRPVVYLHDTPELGLGADPPHGRHEILPGHRVEDYELKCALEYEYAFPLPTADTVIAEIHVGRRSVGWQLDNALVSGFGPDYWPERPRWSCERRDGGTAGDTVTRLFSVGLPFTEPGMSPNGLGYELMLEHWSSGEGSCASEPTGAGPDDAWMCVRESHFTPCDAAVCPEPCGDGTCDAWETCATCGSDCGICGPQVTELEVVAVDCPPSIDVGNPVTCDVVLRNHGTVDAPGFVNQLWLAHDTTFPGGGMLLESCSASGLAAGSTTTLTCTGTVPLETEAGTWYLGVIADGAGVVAEPDESNNIGHDAIEVISDYLPEADLTGGVSCSPGPAATGSEVSCSVTVTNGGGAAAEPSRIELRLSGDSVISDTDTLLATCDVGGLEPGSSRSVTCAGSIPMGTPTGTRYMGAVVDSANDVSESNEDNNSAYDSILVTAGPADLVVSAIDCPMSAIALGEVSCSVQMSNRGDSIAAAFSNALRLSTDLTIDSFDPLLGTCNVSNLSAGATQTITCSGTIPTGHSGNRYVGIIADSSSTVTELDETNNTAYDSIQVTNLPDLVVTSVNCPASATSPGTVSCTVQVRNQGTGAANSITNQIRLSTDTNFNNFDALLGTCNIIALPAGLSQTITCTGTIPVGQIGFRYLGIIADGSSTVSESNETNNTGYDSISLTSG